ncbi:MAG TPA: TonB-dependent receptor plug domain-containing protein [Opitutaceae bacterium]|nr:TonB-dependent receptor plug domain-containing protein [Opitutaceae bacterium]
MKPPTPSVRPHGSSLFLLAALAGAVLARAQVPVTPPPPAPASDVIELNPFTVSTDRDDSYGALNSNSVTRFNVELSKLPVSADIYTQAFMNDVGATTIEDMVQGYSAGVGVAAVDAANVGAQRGDHVAHNYTQIRGFDTSAMQRDSLMPVGPLFNPGSTAPGVTSNFDVERVEVIMGPQSLLYSAGGPGGVINVVSKMARFGIAPSGSLQYRIDQYGSKEGQLDFKEGNHNVGVRVALLDSDDATRRVNVGYKVNGAYGQLLFRLPFHTTMRVSVDQTNEHATLGTSGVALSSVTGDSRAGDNLSYLLANGQLGANSVNATTGAPNSAGAIRGGFLNWGNLDSLGGWLASEYTKTTTETVAFDTVLNEHLSWEIAAGYSTSDYAFRSGPNTLYAPKNSTNPTGDWALGSSPSETDEPAHTKGLRLSIVDTADLFNGRAHSQTILGADFVGSRAHSIAYSYWLADSSFHPVYSAAIKTNDGRTKMPTIYYPIGNGIVRYPLFALGARSYTYDGSNYIRMTSNEVNPALISPANPLGLSGSGLNEYNVVNNKGVFATNMTQWGDDRKLTTLVGLRANDSFDSLIYSPPVYRVAHIRSLDFDLGANYALRPGLAPYFSISDSVTPPQVMFPDPAGNLPKAGRGLGEEIGVKFHNAANTVSGSLALYHSHGTNEEFNNSTISSAINPSGLNGSWSGGGAYFDLDRSTKGAELTLTADPVSNWRIRFSASYQDGTIATDKSYAPVYNDQFYENSSGQVTYKDGTLVYVNTQAFSSKTPVVSSGSAGAQALTVGMMNDPTSLYYANPVNPSGAIRSSSAVATVLKSTSSVHGAILTGATGLPISAMQITPSFGVPREIVAFRAGDRTLGTPKYRFVFTNLYTVPDGWAKGLKIGGSLSASCSTVNYYYLANGFDSAKPAREPFFSPNSIMVDPIIGYERRFRRFTWTTQLNITNLFNHYSVLVMPSQSTGYSSVANLNAAFFGQPRRFLWTNTISF